MQVEVAKRLLDALTAARRIKEFTGKITFQTYSANALVRSAVERQLEIIGEALGKAEADDPSLSASIPDVRRIVGLRNRLIHGYGAVDDEIVWEVVENKIGPLSAILKQLLEKAGYPSR